MAIEQRSFEYLVPIGFRPAVEQQVDAVVAFTIKRRKEEDERAQDDTADKEFDIGFVLEAGEHVLAGIHGADEIKRNESAGDSQQNAGRNTLYGPVAVERKREHDSIAAEDIGKARCRHTTDKDGQQRGHRQVNHQHLEGKYQSGNRGLEDAGNGSRSATAHKGHQRLVVKPENLSEIRADSRSRQHDRSLGTD